MASKRKMPEKSKSDSDDEQPRTAVQAPDLSKHKTLRGIAKTLGHGFTINLLTAYKDVVGRVCDAKVAEHKRLMELMEIADAQPGLPVFAVQEKDGEAGSSGTEPPRTPAKTAAVLPTPPSTGNHHHSAHSLVDGREGALWAETLRNNPELKARYEALTHEEIGYEVAEAGFLHFPKTE